MSSALLSRPGRRVAVGLLAILVLTATLGGVAAADTAPPTTTHRLSAAQPATAGWYRGPVDVHLDAEDADGTILRTEYRVDGGPWQVTGGSEQVIFDGTQASLDRWRMAGPGRFVLLPDGTLTTTGGMGMLWYPARPYGDFVLRLQWRDARPAATQGASNAGVFVRFPDIDEAVTRPEGQRWPCQTGSSFTQPVWVAVHCGHEIQIYDGATGDVQKTGSLYNFQKLDLAQAKPTAQGDWNDYEVRAEGGGDYQVTITRNGEVINSWRNTPGQLPYREGDPGTDVRQFASGYIGLQNHGSADYIQFRNIRVLDLSDPQPVRVSEPGTHTVEYRSTDLAGNVEPLRSVSFRIDGTAPTVTSAVTKTAGGAELALTADDTVAGAGATEISYRVDGGVWQSAPLEERIFDGTSATFDRWSMVGSGSFDLTEEGNLRTVGGMGMLWYPDRQLGDAALRLQWRDARPDGVRSNGGVFVRFPDPEAAVAVPPQERNACQIGLGLFLAEWSAVGCGHEIQVNDGDADPQKTGSVYNFKSLDAVQSRPTELGQWNDYEIRTVGGGSYEVTIVRNGEVINSFVNSPGQRPARPIDPPTDLRQFASGYVGLQNHGASDTIEYRDVRVLDLAPRTATVTISTPGAHVVEYRATDAAGNPSTPTTATVNVE